MDRSLLWIMMDSRLRGNDREEIGNNMRIRELHREIRNYIRILLKEFM